MRFKDKIVLITGSSRGIGRATAIAFGKEGARVVVNYLKDRVSADGTVEEIEKVGGKALAIQADVSVEANVKRMIDEVVERFGSIDILVNNAGIVFDVPIMEKTVEQWERTLAVNLLGVFLCTKYVVPHMRGRTGASIVNISSTNCINTPDPTSADYDASKAGVISLTKNFAQELAPEIRVNSVAPGWIDTDINKDLPEDYIKEEIDKTALGRWGRPGEIAQAILFLCSEDASYVTGSILVADGGYQ